MNFKEYILHIGCSSYATRSWQPLFFPEGLPTKEWFEYYCRHFNTYELNSTFYRFPRLKTLRGWYEKAPGKFYLQRQGTQSNYSYQAVRGLCRGD